MRPNPIVISASMIIGETNEKFANPYSVIIFENAAASIDLDTPDKINIIPAIKLNNSIFLSVI